MEKKPATICYAGDYLRFVQRDTWEWVERVGSTGVVVIAALTRKNELLLVEQYRYAVDSNVLELPAGMVGDINAEEAFEDAAKRELLEETGYTATSLTLVFEGPISPGSTSELMHVYTATNVDYTHAGGGDETESIIVHKVRLDELDAHITNFKAAGGMIDPKIYMGLHLLG